MPSPTSVFELRCCSGRIMQPLITSWVSVPTLAICPYVNNRAQINQHLWYTSYLVWVCAKLGCKTFSLFVCQQRHRSNASLSLPLQQRSNDSPLRACIYNVKCLRRKDVEELMNWRGSMEVILEVTSVKLQRQGGDFHGLRDKVLKLHTEFERVHRQLSSHSSGPLTPQSSLKGPVEITSTPSSNGKTQKGLHSTCLKVFCRIL